MSIVKLCEDDLDTLDSYLWEEAGVPLKINKHCGCTICVLVRDILEINTTIRGDPVLKVLKLIDKMHKRFGQCDSDLLRKLL